MPNWKKVATQGGSPTFNHITASGNISASGLSHTLGGDVTIGDDLYIGGGRHGFDTHGSNTLTILSGSSALIQFAADGATTITNNITASGNISGSSTSTLTVGGAATIGGTAQASSYKISGATVLQGRSYRNYIVNYPYKHTI